MRTFLSKWVFFRLKKGEGLVFQGGEDFIPFNRLSLYLIQSKAFLFIFSSKPIDFSLFSFNFSFTMQSHGCAEPWYHGCSVYLLLTFLSFIFGERLKGKEPAWHQQL